MASGSGLDPDDRSQEPVHGGGQREDSNVATSSPSAVAAAGGADASLPSPLPAAPADRLQERAPEQTGSGSGSGSRGTHGSSSAAAVVDRMGEGLSAIEESPPRSAGSCCFAGTVKQGESSHPKKGFFRKIKKIFTGKKEVVGEERQTYSEHVHRQVGEEERETYREHVHRQTLPITEVGNHYHVTEDKPIGVDLDAYSSIRPVHGDGECFYRSFIFSYLEQVLDRQDSDEEKRLICIMQTLSADTNFVSTSEFDNIFMAFVELIHKVEQWKNRSREDDIASADSYRKEKLLEFFSTYDTTNNIFAFLRYLVAIHICSHGTRITGLSGNYTLKDWCLEHITPAHKDASHVMMEALATALEVPLRVERLYGGGTDEDRMYTGPGDVRVTLLYTKDHYDIIYPRAPSAESSSTQASQSEHPAG